MPRIRNLNTRSKLRRARFTLNNPTDNERKLLKSILNTHPDANTNRRILKIQYIVFQEERVQTTHIQGYIEWTEQVRPLGRKIKTTPFYARMNFLRADFPAKAILYCKKPQSRVEGGLAGEAGNAKKQQEDSLQAIIEQQKQGISLEEALDACPRMDLMHSDKIIAYFLRKKIQENPRRFEIYIGPTGAGKSTTARDKYPDHYEVPALTSHNKRWDWHGYRGQKASIIDEFHDGYMPYKTALRFFDQFGFQLESKHKNFDCKSEVVILTMNADKDPIYWYKGVKDKKALERRFNERVRIYDFELTPDGVQHHKATLRTYGSEGFKFKKNLGGHFRDLDLSSPSFTFARAGTGDQSQGNGFADYGQ